MVNAHNVLWLLLSLVPSHVYQSVAGRFISEGDLVFDLNAYLTSSPYARRLLVQTLQDSFEANKEIALQLLLDLPVDVDLFEVRYCICTYIYSIRMEAPTVPTD